jgi:hypothetical protein
LTKDKRKYFLDLVPFAIQTICLANLLWTIATTNIIFSYEHYIGLTLFLFTGGLLLKRHKLGVLILGLTLLLGLFKVVSYSPIIISHSFGGSLGGYTSPEVKIQAIFLLWLFIHIILSARHYIGILTKKYWQDIIKN